MDKTNWTVENEHDKKVGQYLDTINRAPYGTIVLIMLGLLILFAGFILVGSF